MSACATGHYLVLSTGVFSAFPLHTAPLLRKTYYNLRTLMFLSFAYFLPCMHTDGSERSCQHTWRGALYIVAVVVRVVTFRCVDYFTFCDEGAPWRHDGGDRGVTDRSRRSSRSPEPVDLAWSNNGALPNHTRLLQGGGAGGGCFTKLGHRVTTDNNYRRGST